MVYSFSQNSSRYSKVWTIETFLRTFKLKRAMRKCNHSMNKCWRLISGQGVPNDKLPGLTRKYDLLFKWPFREKADKTTYSHKWVGMTFKKGNFHTKSKWRNKWFCCFISLGEPFIILLTADNEGRTRPITRYSKELVNSAFTLFVFARNGLNKNSTT